MKNYTKTGLFIQSAMAVIMLCTVSSMRVTHAQAVALKKFKLGVENISADFVKQFNGKRIGLITNQTGMDQSGRSTIDILKDKGLSISYLFAPEHGVDGTVGAGERVANSVDKRTNIPIVSLYGHGSGKMIPENILAKVDVIMFDIQDSGMRHYTYISTLFHAMRVAQQYDKQFVVFDRPNPLGVTMEGPLVEDKLRSFISIAAIPLRHGMTIGELAWYFNLHELKKPVNLQVVKMHQYNRLESVLPDLSAPLSPGLRTMQACYGYSFLGLLGEIAPFGIGLHTEARFQCIVLPKKMGVKRKVWARLQQELKGCGIDAIMHEYKHPKTNTCFSGLRLPIKDINKVQAFAGLYAVLNFFNKEGIRLSFSRSFDLAVGTAKMREALQGKNSHTSFVEQVNTQLVGFLDKAQSSFMYTPFPTPQFIK
ncbi:MAG: DUF1343 domain-containing protein [Candidatus Dependentiae bacterium]|nr:DUF1343 domain-containing protein [Candidatus Dependentiae bacterium]